MNENHFNYARMRIVNGEAFLAGEQGYVFHAESGKLGHLEDCTAFAEMVWGLLNTPKSAESS